MIRHFLVISSAAALLMVQACGADAPTQHYGSSPDSASTPWPSRA